MTRTENKAGSSVDTWQLIETAPKDGSSILVIFDLYELPVVVFWHVDEGNPFEGEPACSWWWDDGRSGRCEDGSKPLYWSPIPCMLSLYPEKEKT